MANILKHNNVVISKFDWFKEISTFVDKIISTAGWLSTNKDVVLAFVCGLMATENAEVTLGGSGEVPGIKESSSCPSKRFLKNPNEALNKGAHFFAFCVNGVNQKSSNGVQEWCPDIGPINVTSEVTDAGYSISLAKFLKGKGITDVKAYVVAAAKSPYGEEAALITAFGIQTRTHLDYSKPIEPVSMFRMIGRWSRPIGSTLGIAAGLFAILLYQLLARAKNERARDSAFETACDLYHRLVGQFFYITLDAEKAYGAGAVLGTLKALSYSETTLKVAEVLALPLNSPERNNWFDMFSRCFTNTAFLHDSSSVWHDPLGTRFLNVDDGASDNPALLSPYNNGRVGLINYATLYEFFTKKYTYVTRNNGQWDTGAISGSRGPAYLDFLRLPEVHYDQDEKGETGLNKFLSAFIEFLFFGFRSVDLIAIKDRMISKPETFQNMVYYRRNGQTIISPTKVSLKNSAIKGGKSLGYDEYYFNITNTGRNVPSILNVNENPVASPSLEISGSNANVVETRVVTLLDKDETVGAGVVSRFSVPFSFDATQAASTTPQNRHDLVINGGAEVDNSDASGEATSRSVVPSGVKTVVITLAVGAALILLLIALGVVQMLGKFLYKHGILRGITSRIACLPSLLRWKNSKCRVRIRGTDQFLLMKDLYNYLALGGTVMVLGNVWNVVDFDMTKTFSLKLAGSSQPYIVEEFDQETNEFVCYDCSSQQVRRVRATAQEVLLESRL